MFNNGQLDERGVPGTIDSDLQLCAADLLRSPTPQPPCYSDTCVSGMLLVFRGAHSCSCGVAFTHVSAMFCGSVISGSAEVVDF
jgi:hypothetical protein